ncbi:MAG: phosphatidate cytidylyltransferase [Bacteriovoracaceae bacterium]|jgi:phosphatidate cytidylyltransferase|nr:phosphatidate cytidylyltransferase [Bacteriovoracaceae bacterium]
MSNTQLRIVSALMLSAIVAACIVAGNQMVLILFGAVSILAIDELVCNFFKKKRFSIRYQLSELIFIIPFAYIFFIANSESYAESVSYYAIGLNFLLIVYLFSISMESKLIDNLGNKFPEFSGILFLLPLVSLSSLLFFKDWKLLLATLLVVNFGMDSGAWLIGKNFGKNKLWKKVSPNKTIEGLLGGMFIAGLVGCIAWKMFFGDASPTFFVLFALLGAMSQLGDLIQSKMKRQAGVKDSSSLIPGHGGVYDRIDGLIFLAPFYLMALKFIYNK